MNYANSTQTAPAREREIPDQINVLAKALEELSEVAANVTDRLSPVSQCQPPTGKDEASVEANLCPVAASIRNARRNVFRITAQLRDVLNRLEV